MFVVNNAVWRWSYWPETVAVAAVGAGNVSATRSMCSPDIAASKGLKCI